MWSRNPPRRSAPTVRTAAKPPPTTTTLERPCFTAPLPPDLGETLHGRTSSHHVRRRSTTAPTPLDPGRATRLDLLGPGPGSLLGPLTLEAAHRGGRRSAARRTESG